MRGSVLEKQSRRMLIELCLIFLVGLWMWHRHKSSHYWEMIEKFPCPKLYPIVGNVVKFRVTAEEIFEILVAWCDEFYGSPLRIQLGPETILLISDPKDFEILLGNNAQIDKGSQYKLLLPWFGTGLLTSTGDKWRSHRKIITPTFHFTILEEFVDVFNANGKILVEKLNEKVNGPGFDIYDFIRLFGLDVISETAMGVSINAQNDSDSEYARAIKNLSDIILQRIYKPWLGPDFLFWFSSYKGINDASLAIVHKKTNDMIKTRKEEIQKRLKNKTAPQEENCYGAKKRLAFLDMLIESSINGAKLTDEEIREEVDTFMFEGHDTTSSGISFALWALSRHQEIQDLAYQEIMRVFPDSEEPLSFRGLQELKYLERVIKESLRLYPSVPFISRQLKDDLTLSGGLVAPKGATVCALIYNSLRDPKTWTDPLKFDPDRFTPENSEGRHPYAFVPFSAGPRNCIGQKFAILEMKSTLALFLRGYKILPDTEQPDLRLAFLLVLKSTNGIMIKIVPRK